jgi:hypothetical protein
VPFVALIPLLFVLDRPVMIDDTLFLAASRQIARAPLRPYDFPINWYGWVEPFWDVFKNPPLLAYWLAVTEGLVGTRESVLHAAMLPFTVGATCAGVRLARRFAGDSPWTTATWVAAPAFLVSAATLMADVPALALSLWGVVLWVEGVDADLRGRRRLGALLAGLAVIMKYTAVIGVAVLVVYAVALRDRTARGTRNAWRPLADVWVASLPLFAWGLVTLGTTGRVHFVEALSVGGGGLDPNPGWMAHRAIAILTFMGGTAVFPLLAAAPALRRSRWIGALAAVAFGIAAALATPEVWPARALQPGSLVLVGVLATVGAAALLGAAHEAVRDRTSAFLGIWLALHIVYLWLWSWTLAARFVLPAIVPLALLLARARDRDRGRRDDALFAGGAVVALVTAVVVLIADGVPGLLYRDAVPAIAAQAQREGRSAFFTGSWGFHHYAQRAGLVRLDTRAPAVRGGDLVLQPYYAANNALPDDLERRLRRLDDIVVPPPPLHVHTMNINVGAALHSSAFGPLPFFPSRMPAEGIRIWEVRR